MTRLCVFCRHFRLDMGEPDYSEVTPGYSAIVECAKGKWGMNPAESEGVFRAHIEKASNCRFYEIPK